MQTLADAAFYLNPPTDPVWNQDRALRVLFLLRQLKQCQSEGSACTYSAAETQALQAAFIAYEMRRFRQWCGIGAINALILAQNPP
ncbi:hypothetical protein [Thiothrix fructosivorans]|uniref:Uncharacterized protein n=1 Tax=Thiothrix fructosivorans TaxID=111770 RepID=A0ABS3IQW0_9GAMM|nr:hypothetical protein [Thiothrix fructosivorans]MBO0615417.1 hypothetical protein [Thiothrix fructosivorans]